MTGTVESERKYLTNRELACLFLGARKGRHGVRDVAMLHLLVRHGLRATELCGLDMTDLDMRRRHPTIHIRRLKDSENIRPYIATSAVRGLKAWLKLRNKRFDYGDQGPVFITERGEPFTRHGVYYLVTSWAKRGIVPIPTHPHMLRHTCGYSLGEKGFDTIAIQGYLGHKDIRNTAHYTALSPERFKAIRDAWGLR